MNLRVALCCIFILNFSFQNLCSGQVKDTVAYVPKVHEFIVPTIFIGYGVLSVISGNSLKDLDRTTKSEIQEDHPKFAAHADDYLQFSPAAVVYGLNLAGIKGKHNLGDASGYFLLSEIIMNSTVHALKTVSNRERPDHSGFNSFPSGHTANAFATAEFLHQEYKDISPWYGYTAFTIATATGIMRMYNNRHWLSDVVAGAGFGIVSTKVAYLLYPKLKAVVLGKRNLNYNLIPSYQQHRFGFSLHSTF